jgi:HPt (histidine-containing phosphotransfer) domain-containing protein
MVTAESEGGVIGNFGDAVEAVQGLSDMQVADSISAAQILPVWDGRALERIVGSHLEAQDRLLKKYLLTAAATVTAMQAAAVAEQWQSIAQLAHKLKSSSRSVGAMRLGSLCEAIEPAGSAGSAGACRSLAALVVQAFDEAQLCIRAGLKKDAPS